jgi:hypothetical protein
MKSKHTWPNQFNWTNSTSTMTSLSLSLCRKLCKEKFENGLAREREIEEGLFLTPS